MNVIYKKYGPYIEITTTEKTPSKVRISSSRKGAPLHRGRRYPSLSPTKVRRPVARARRKDNIRRTKGICVRRVSAAIEKFGRPLLVTLTFSGDASDASYANDSLRTFQVRLRAKYPGAESIFIPERSPKGRIHFHGLLFNVPLHLGDTRRGRRTLAHGTERTTRELASLWGEGYVDARQTDGSVRLAHYISKYITKGAGETLFNGMRLIRMSRGIPKETILRGELAEAMQHRYATEKPIKEWEGHNVFQGKITKKLYQHENNSGS